MLNQYLRCFTSYQQDDWTSLLPSAEFAYNNASQSSTGRSPFFANHGFHPRFNPTSPTTSEVPRAEQRVNNLKELNKTLIQELEHAKENYKRYADRKRIAAPEFQAGDKVWLSHRNISSERPSRKLEYRKLGPLTITKKLSAVTYRLELPPSLGRTHPVFHVSLLEPYVSNTIPGRYHPPPPPITVNDNLEYTVHAILDSKLFRGRLYYLVDGKLSPIGTVMGTRGEHSRRSTHGGIPHKSPRKA